MADMNLSSTKARFDPTITLGHLITLGGFLFAFAGSWYLTDYRLTAIEKQMTGLQVVVVHSARIDERLNEHGRRLDRLEAGPR